MPHSLSLSTVFPWLTLFWFLSRLQLSTVAWRARQDIHETALFDRMSMSLSQGMGRSNEKDVDEVHTQSADDRCVFDKNTMTGHGEELKVAAQQNGNFTRRITPPTNRISRCVEEVKSLHECLRTQEDRARCSSLSAKLKHCVKAHTKAHQDAWEWARTRYGKMRVPGLTLIAVLLASKCTHDYACQFG